MVAVTGVFSENTVNPRAATEPHSSEGAAVTGSGSSVRRFICAGLIAALAMPASAADPLTLILLRLLRDQIITSVATRAYEGVTEDQQQRAEAAAQQPQSRRPFGMDDTQLRRLIDEGFVHLTELQRDEVYASVKRIVDDPRYTAQVPEIISELAMKASAVRQAHEQLNRLTETDKRVIAAQAREEYEKMPAAEREDMLRILRLRMVPLPVDLNDMILAEFSRPLPDEKPVAPAQVPVAEQEPQRSIAAQ